MNLPRLFASGWGGSFSRRCRSGFGIDVGWGWGFAFGDQGLVDHLEEEVDGQRAVEFVAVDEERWCRVNTESETDLFALFNAGSVLLVDAGVEFVGIGFLGCGLFANQVVELRVGDVESFLGRGFAGLGILGWRRRADVAGVGVDVVDRVPIAGRRLCGEAVDVD